MAQQPDPQAADVLDTASRTIRGSAIWRGILLGITVTMLIVGALGLYVSMAFMACLALGDLTGATWWLALAYLVLLALVLHGSYYRDYQRLRRPHLHDSDSDVHLTTTLRTAVRAGLDTLKAWRTRALTTPLVALTAVHLVHIGLSFDGAVGIAVTAYLGQEVLRAASVPTRARLKQILRFANRDRPN